MNSIVVKNIVRFIGLVIIQVALLQRIPNTLESYNNFDIFIYPIFIMLLPFRIPHAVLIILGFMVGISVDFFYDSPGVHASASVFTAFIRPIVAKGLEPREGYNLMVDIPTKHKFGLAWFVPYMLTLLFLHLFFYYSVEAFTFAYIDTILKNTIFSFMISGVFIMLYQFIFNPKT